MLQNWTTSPKLNVWREACAVHCLVPVKRTFEQNMTVNMTLAKSHSVRFRFVFRVCFAMASSGWLCWLAATKEEHKKNKNRGGVRCEDHTAFTRSVREESKRGACMLVCARAFVYVWEEREHDNKKESNILKLWQRKQAATAAALFSEIPFLLLLCIFCFPFCTAVSRHWVKATLCLLFCNLVLNFKVEAFALCGGWVCVGDCTCGEGGKEGR